MMNTPHHFTKEVFCGANLMYNRKMYVDLSAYMTPNDAAPTTLINSDMTLLNFGSVSKLHDIAGLCFDYSTTPYENELSFWLLKWSRYYEVTNVTNVPIYCRLHKIYLKRDSPFESLMDYLMQIYERYWANNTAMNQRVNASGALSSLSFEDFLEQVIEPYIFASPSDTVGTTHWAMDQFEVLGSAFKHPTLRKAIKKHLHVKSSKEFVLGPQQQVAFTMKKKSPTLINSLDHILPLTQGTRTIVNAPTGTYDGVLGTGQIARGWKGLTCTVILEVVGMTSVSDQMFNSVYRAPLPSASGYFTWHFKDHVSVAPRNAKMYHYVKDQSAYGALGINPTSMQPYGIRSSRGANAATSSGLTKVVDSVAFGASNNAGSVVYPDQIP